MKIPLLCRAWPLPAVLGWGAAWLLAHVALAASWPPSAAALLALLPVALLAWAQPGWVRPTVLVVGLVAVLALATPLAPSAGAVPAGWWLVGLAVLLALYPLRAWRDAPLFPTPAHALDDLPVIAPLPDGAEVIDAGSGVGDGLRALRRAYPEARLEGVEWSPALALVCRLRCPWARVRRGDLWARSWKDAALVYLFQRPETMPRAWDKALAEMAPGAWLVSLEFAVPGVEPEACLRLDAQRCVWAYRLPPRVERRG